MQSFDWAAARRKYGKPKAKPQFWRSLKKHFDISVFYENEEGTLCHNTRIADDSSRLTDDIAKVHCKFCLSLYQKHTEAQIWEPGKRHRFPWDEPMGGRNE